MNTAKDCGLLYTREHLNTFIGFLFSFLNEEESYTNRERVNES